MRKLLSSPKWRHGWLSVSLLTAFAALCLAFSIAVDALEAEYGLRRDMSFNKYATTGETTSRVLKELTRDVDIYALYQSGSEDAQLMELLSRYEAQSDRVSAVPTDIAKNPGILSRFGGSGDSTLGDGSVIISCEETGRYKALHHSAGYSDFVTQGYNIDKGVFEIEGLKYEKQITEAIVYVTQDSVPVIGMLGGHGELSETALESFIEFLSANNYDSREISLIAGDSPEGIDMLLIASPQKDISYEEALMIKSFAEGGGSIMITRDYTDPIGGMTNYMSLLSSYGVKPLPGVVIAGENDTGSYYGERIYLLPYMCPLDFTLPLISGKLDVLLLAGASAFETPDESLSDSSLTADTVLKSGPNAYLRDPGDGSTSINRQEGDRTGEMSLAVYASRMHASGNISRLFAIGNSTVLTDENMYQRTFSQEFFLQLLGELLPQRAVSLDIASAAAYHPGLRPGGRTLGILICAALPLLVLAMGLAVLLPRKGR